MKYTFIDFLLDVMIFLIILFILVGMPLLYLFFIPSEFWKGVLIGAHYMFIIRSLFC